MTDGVSTAEGREGLRRGYLHHTEAPGALAAEVSQAD